MSGLDHARVVAAALAKIKADGFKLDDPAMIIKPANKTGQEILIDAIATATVDEINVHWQGGGGGLDLPEGDGYPHRVGTTWTMQDKAFLDRSTADGIYATPAGVAIAIAAAIVFGGNGVASTIAHSDHNHDSTYAALQHTHTSSQIVDATAAGRALLTATDVPAQRTALGLTGWATKAYTNGSTTDVAEGTNLYYTDTRARAAISGTAPISVSAGVITHLGTDGYMHVPATGTTNSGRALVSGSTAGSAAWTQLTTAHVSGLTGWATKAWTNGSTTDVAEGSNLYYTDARARTACTPAAIGAAPAVAGGYLPLSAGAGYPLTGVLLPSTTGTLDLGCAALRWNKAWVASIDAYGAGLFGSIVQAKGIYSTTTMTVDGVFQAAGSTSIDINGTIIEKGTALSSKYVGISDSRLTDARPPTAHTHAIAGVTGLQSALDGKQAAGSYLTTTGTAAFAALLALPSGSTSTTSTSGWNPLSLQYQAFGQSYKNTVISGDTGDFVLWLRPSVYVTGGTELCMAIDGDYYAGSGLYKVWHAGNLNPSNFQPVENQRLSTTNNVQFGSLSTSGSIFMPSGVMRGVSRPSDGGATVFAPATGSRSAISNGVGSTLINRYEYAGWMGFVTGGNNGFWGITQDHNYTGNGNELSIVAGAGAGHISFFAGTPALLSNGCYQAPLVGDWTPSALNISTSLTAPTISAKTSLASPNLLWREHTASTTNAPYAGAYGASVTPSNSNYAISIADDGTNTGISGTSQSYMAVNGTVAVLADATQVLLSVGGNPKFRVAPNYTQLIGRIVTDYEVITGTVASGLKFHTIVTNYNSGVSIGAGMYDGQIKFITNKTSGSQNVGSVTIPAGASRLFSWNGSLWL